MSEAAKTPSQAVATHVRIRREERGLSQRELAKRMVTLGHRWGDTIVSRVERGERDITVGEFVALALILDIPPLALLLPIGEEVTFGDQPDSPFAPVKKRLFELWLNGYLPLGFDPQKGIGVTAGADDIIDPDQFMEAIRTAHLPSRATGTKAGQRGED